MSAPVTSATFDLARRAAAATGKPFMFGVRPNGSMFVHCDSIEFDGSFSSTAGALVSELVQRTLAARRAAEVAVQAADERLKELEGTA